MQEKIQYNTKSQNFIERHFNKIKYIILICVYSYLAYSLIVFDKYDEFFNGFKNIDCNRLFFLALAIMFMPINWILESLKWQSLLNIIKNTRFITAIKSVLIGLTAGFISPNRIGEPMGRILNLKDYSTSQVITLSFVGSFAQTFATCLYALIAIIFFVDLQINDHLKNSDHIFFIGLIITTLITLLFFTIPYWGQYLAKRNKYIKLTNILKILSQIRISKLFIITIYSIIRYSIYSLQYFFLLRFFNVDIGTEIALILIPINYFLVSITPSISFSEIGIRASYAMILMGTFATNTLGAALAGTTIWIINYIVPMLIGSTLLIKKK